MFTTRHLCTYPLAYQACSTPDLRAGTAPIAGAHFALVYGRTQSRASSVATRDATAPTYLPSQILGAKVCTFVFLGTDHNVFSGLRWTASSRLVLFADYNHIVTFCPVSKA